MMKKFAHLHSSKSDFNDCFWLETMNETYENIWAKQFFDPNDWKLVLSFHIYEKPPISH